jgi:hypothetical protein
MISNRISDIYHRLPILKECAAFPVQLPIFPLHSAQRPVSNDGYHDPDRETGSIQVHDYADQGPLADRDMDEDTWILATVTLLKHTPYCLTVADLEQLLQEIPVQPPVVVPVMTVQEAVAARDLPSLDVDATNVFSQIKHIGSVNSTVEGPRHETIPSTWQSTAICERIVRYRCFM